MGPRPINRLMNISLKANRRVKSRTMRHREKEPPFPRRPEPGSQRLILGCQLLLQQRQWKEHRGQRKKNDGMIRTGTIPEVEDYEFPQLYQPARFLQLSCKRNSCCVLHYTIQPNFCQTKETSPVHTSDLRVLNVHMQQMKGPRPPSGGHEAVSSDPC